MGKCALVLLFSIFGVALAAPKRTRAAPPLEFEVIYSDLLCYYLGFYKTQENATCIASVGRLLNDLKHRTHTPSNRTNT